MSTSTLGSNNAVIIYQDLILNRVGINNTNPSCGLDINNICNIRSNLYVQGSIVANGSNCYIQSQYPRQSPAQFSQNSNGQGTFINYSASNFGFLFQNPLTRIGSANFQNNITVQNNIIMSNTTGNGIIFCNSNNYIGINQALPQYSLDVFGALNATTYCNFMINSSSNTSTSNAPTNYALSTVNSASVFASNASYFASNNINPYIRKLTKAVDTSNPQTITVSWQTASTSNQYYILLDVDQMFTSSNLGNGIRNQRLLIGTSNQSINSYSAPIVFGSYSNLYTSMSTIISASNSTSVTLQSSTNIITAGEMANVFTVQVINETGVSELGNISLS